MRKLLFLPIFLIVLGGIVGNALRFTERKPDKMADFSKIPLVIDKTYFGREHPIDELTAEVLKATVTTNRVYTTSDELTFQLFVAYFESQKYGSQIHSPRHCLPGSGWKIEAIEPYELIVPDGTKKIINHSVIRDNLKQVVMLYWYETRSGSIQGEYGLKLDLIKNSLLFNPTDAVIIRLTIDAGHDISLATEKGLEFINRLYPHIEESLPF
ncbi:MAG: EpsI family protein [Candidatus Zixiibacteriota bacterium]|nr:MAG: EpsI family protein [candidate division Zixibacteria bacterium]HHI02109.1 EpsI family protein [candidate division Zixibacteria bacterium]